MRDSDGSRRPWRQTVGQCPPGRHAQTSPAITSQTVMGTASATGASGGYGGTYFLPTCTDCRCYAY